MLFGSLDMQLCGYSIIGQRSGAKKEMLHGLGDNGETGMSWRLFGQWVLFYVSYLR